MHTGEPKRCVRTGRSYELLQHELDLLAQISPTLQGTQYLIPPSAFHPDVDHQRHLAWRNEKTLYRTTCALTGASIITNINPAQGYTIYNFHDRWGDAWDPLEYGIVFDHTKTFTENRKAMFEPMPQVSLNVSPSMENCDYCNYGLNAKDCYMSTSPVFSEQCYYSYLSFRCSYDVDGYANTSSQYCYGCIYAMNCYECQHIFYSSDCAHSHYLLDCRDCEYCVGCVNLSHKKYCIFNKQYEKDAYFEIAGKLLGENSSTQLLSKFHTFSLTFPRRATRGSNNQDSIGDLNFNTKNLYYSFDMQECTDADYCRVGGIQTSDLVRCTLVGLGTRCYHMIGTAQSDASAFCVGTNSTNQCFYCYYCRNCEYCFGCVRLLHKKYCIFNTQYTQEEYERLLPAIIQTMQKTPTGSGQASERGQFLDPSLSPFPYNDTDAYEWFPETEETIAARGRKRVEQEPTIFSGTSYVPLDIEEYQDTEKQNELLAGILVCEVTKKPFRIIKQELDFYLKFSIPIPTKHPQQRYLERVENWRLPRTLYDRTCAKTSVDILTPYSSERPEIVWHEDVWDHEFM